VYNIEIKPLTTNDFNNNVFNGGGLQDGLAISQGPGVGGDIDEQLTVRFNVGAAPQVMFREVFPWYQKIQSLIAQQRRELDDKKRATILEDLQKEMAMQMPAVPWPGAANSFSLAWPYFGNYNVFTTTALAAQTEIWPQYWFDASKKV
jgi:ABC-type transport system substrate-binding protein